MNKIILIIVTLLLACNVHKDKPVQYPGLSLHPDGNYDTPPVKLIRAFRNSGNWDSVYLYSDGHLVIMNKPKSSRYFLITYETMLKKSNEPIIGDLFLECTGFPSKVGIDSIAYDGFSRKKCFYQEIVILSVFEFKEYSDYNSFRNGHTNALVVKDKMECPLWNDSGLTIAESPKTWLKRHRKGRSL